MRRTLGLLLIAAACEDTSLKSVTAYTDKIRANILDDKMPSQGTRPFSSVARVDSVGAPMLRELKFCCNAQRGTYNGEIGFGRRRAASATAGFRDAASAGENQGRSVDEAGARASREGRTRSDHRSGQRSFRQFFLQQSAVVLHRHGGGSSRPAGDMVSDAALHRARPCAAGQS